MRSVIILGSGIAGLSCALRLQGRGWDLRLIERGGGDGRSGHGFIVPANGLSALSTLCAVTGPRVQGALLDCFELRSPQGEPRATEHLGVAMGMRHSALLDALRAELTPDLTIEQGLAVDFVRGAGGEVAGVRLESGEVLQADLYVVADGCRSRLRGALFAGRAWSPVRVVEVVSHLCDPALEASLGRRFVKMVDPDGGRAMGVVPCGRGQLVWFAQIEASQVPDGLCDGASREALLRQQLAGWADPAPRLLDRTDFTRSYVWRAADMEPLPALFHGPVALVGDAAHPFLPFTSQGVSAAMEDALALGEALDAVSFLPAAAAVRAALPRYSAARLPLVSRTLAGGRALQERFLAGCQGLGPQAAEGERRLVPMCLP